MNPDEATNSPRRIPTDEPQFQADTQNNLSRPQIPAFCHVRIDTTGEVRFVRKVIGRKLEDGTFV